MPGKDALPCQKCKSIVQRGGPVCEKYGSIFHPECAKKKQLKFLSELVVNCCEIPNDDLET